MLAALWQAAGCFFLPQSSQRRAAQAWSDANDLYRFMGCNYTLLDSDDALFASMNEATATAEPLKVGAIQRVLQKLTVRDRRRLCRCFAALAAGSGSSSIRGSLGSSSG